MLFHSANRFEDALLPANYKKIQDWNCVQKMSPYCFNKNWWFLSYIHLYEAFRYSCMIKISSQWLKLNEGHAIGIYKTCIAWQEK